MDHTGVRPHPCTQCKLTFKTSNSLKKHKLSVHSDIKHFACQFCGSRFSTSSGVLRHQKKQRCSALRPGDRRTEEDTMLEDEDKVEASKEQMSGNGMNLVKQEGQQEAPPAWRSLALLRGEESRLETTPQSHSHSSYRLHLPP